MGRAQLCIQKTKCSFSGDTVCPGGLALRGLSVCWASLVAWDHVLVPGHEGAPCLSAESKPSPRCAACLPALGLLWGDRGALHIAGCVCGAEGTPAHAPL